MQNVLGLKIREIYRSQRKRMEDRKMIKYSSQRLSKTQILIKQMTEEETNTNVTGIKEKAMKNTDKLER